METTKDLPLEQIPAKLDEQLATLTKILSDMPDEQLETPVSMWGMTMPTRMWFAGLLSKQFTAYKMQLFLYLKSAGLEHLNSANLWEGRDSKPGEEM